MKLGNTSCALDWLINRYSVFSIYVASIVLAAGVVFGLVWFRFVNAQFSLKRHGGFCLVYAELFPKR